MESRRDGLARITNALATPGQLAASHARGPAKPLLAALHHLGGSLVQLSGALLKLPADAIATAAVLFHRFHLLAGFGEFSATDTVAACVFIASKACEFPLRPGAILGAVNTAAKDALAVGASQITRQDGTHLSTHTLYATELQVLTTLAFDTHVVTPYTLLIEYLDAMAIDGPRKKLVAQRAWNYINDSLKTHICVLHQPNAVAVTAIWLAGRELDIEFLDGERWWTAFDVDTEDMGHIFLLLRQGRHTAVKERDRVLEGKELALTVAAVARRVQEL